MRKTAIAQASTIADPKLISLAPLLAPAAASFLSKLAAQGIQTLSDVRRVGGLARFTEPADAAAARLIEAHADLARFSADTSANAALIGSGYDSTLKIATASRSRFIAAAAPILGNVGAARVQVAAVALYRALDHVLAATRVDAANRVPTGLPTSVDATLRDGERDFCNCCDCQAAQSPAAYLADLLSYITRYLENRRQPVTLDYLVANYYQPFGDLPTDCEAVEQPVRQARICIEVLRAYLEATMPGPPAALAAALVSAETPYLQAVYAALLAELGTTSQELRVARRAELATRTALAARLGLTIDPVRIRPARQARCPRTQRSTDDALCADGPSRFAASAVRAGTRAPLRACRHHPQPAV